MKVYVKSIWQPPCVEGKSCHSSQRNS